MAISDPMLICGGAGYIGSSFCYCLKKEGYHPIIVDNLSKSDGKVVSDFEFYNYDIGDYDKLSSLIKRRKIDVVFHFSAFIEVSESVLYPEVYYENNTAKTISLLKACIDSGCRYFIFSSSAAVYGIPDEIPIDEESLCYPINPYGKSKLMIENVLQDLEQKKRLKSVILRYFNASGALPTLETGEAHQPESHIIPNLLDVALGRKEYFQIFGTDYPTYDGTCIRDYIHVEDLASAHLLSAKYLLENNKSEIFNLGSEKGYSIREIINKVEEITKKKINVIEGKRREGDPPVLIASSDKAKKILKWEPQHNLTSIIDTAWKWHKKRFG
ncbi:MAG: UDP-glucose 4-epimerase GalE [Spirochaetes bacterium]|nr:UDP-glucose 4-epimerase GalE [Spirochaetota bacterium]